MPRWEAEIEAAGWTVERMNRSIDHEAARYRRPAPELTNIELRSLAHDALADGSSLVERKVFSKRDVIVAVAPELYGRNLGELGRVVKRTLADPEAVRLLGVPGATQPAYATATTIAREQAIARCVESQVARPGAPAVSAEVADAAVTRADSALGRPLTDGQRDAVEAILTSGRGVELVVGVAGAGKTTALAAARDAFEAAGYELVGTSTSGQAARTLGREAGIDESRTLASLNWRIAHNSLQLSARHVAVLDEAAMTDDAALLAFLEAARATGTKVVMVGDPRQLSSVGPGGGFEALVKRFGGAVHVLAENVRQHDPAERAALGELRSGSVDDAVSWYAGHGRIAVSADRDTALDATVAGWAADVAQGADTAMYAWKRMNVAELNRRARWAMEAKGKLYGPELEVGRVGYRAGDRIVTLAPGANGEIVTSERGTVIAVDTKRRELGATMDDGRFQRFAGDDIDADHLAHGYAVTVHRSQGATVARAHVLEDGGGRELAYVKMSRARERTTLYPVADSPEQATDDLGRSWSHSRRIGWAIDAGTPTREPEKDRTLEPLEPARLRHARLVAERAALAAVIPADPPLPLPHGPGPGSPAGAPTGVPGQGHRVPRVQRHAVGPGRYRLGPDPQGVAPLPGQSGTVRPPPGPPAAQPGQGGRRAGRTAAGRLRTPGRPRAGPDRSRAAGGQEAARRARRPPPRPTALRDGPSRGAAPPRPAGAPDQDGCIRHGRRASGPRRHRSPAAERSPTGARPGPRARPGPEHGPGAVNGGQARRPGSRASSILAAIVPGGVKAKPTGVGCADGLDPACLGGVGSGRKRRDSWSDRPIGAIPTRPTNRRACGQRSFISRCARAVPGRPQRRL